MEFLAAALGKPTLYRYADPLGALNVAVMTDGDQLWWHFDQTDFVVSIALRDADEGGDFEYVPLIRSRRRRALRRRRRRCSPASRSSVVHGPDGAGHAAALRGPPLDAPRDADRRVDAAPRRAARLRHRSPGRRARELLQLVRYGRAG